MDYTFGVRGVQCIGHFDGQSQQIAHLHWLSAHAVLQRDAVEIFHGNEAIAVFFTDVVDRADVGMVQSGSRFGFATEPFDGGCVVGQVFGETHLCRVQPGLGWSAAGEIGKVERNGVFQALPILPVDVHKFVTQSAVA